jgi:hypothetical protein
MSDPFGAKKLSHGLFFRHLCQILRSAFHRLLQNDNRFTVKRSPSRADTSKNLVGFTLAAEQFKENLTPDDIPTPEHPGRHVPPSQA